MLLSECLKLGLTYTSTLCVLFYKSKHASKPVLFYTGSKICINTVKTQGTQSASSLVPMAATFPKKLDSYTHRSLEDSSALSWFVRPVNPTKPPQRWAMFIAAPSSLMQMSSAKNCCMEKQGTGFVAAGRGVSLCPAAGEEAATQEGEDLKFGVSISSSQHGKDWQNLSLGISFSTRSLEIWREEKLKPRRALAINEMLLLSHTHHHQLDILNLLCARPQCNNNCFPT